MSFISNNLNNAIINSFNVGANVGAQPKPQQLGFASAKASQLAEIASIKPSKLDVSSNNMKGFDATGFNGYTSSDNIAFARGQGGVTNQVRTLGIA